jgi:hypothetical protein
MTLIYGTLHLHDRVAKASLAIYVARCARRFYRFNFLGFLSQEIREPDGASSQAGYPGRC